MNNEGSNFQSVSKTPWKWPATPLNVTDYPLIADKEIADSNPEYAWDEVIKEIKPKSKSVDTRPD